MSTRQQLTRLVVILLIVMVSVLALAGSHIQSLQSEVNRKRAQLEAFERKYHNIHNDPRSSQAERNKATADRNMMLRIYQGAKARLDNALNDERQAAQQRAERQRVYQQWRSKVNSQQQVMNGNNQNYRAAEERCRYLRGELSKSHSSRGKVESLRDQLRQAEKDRDYWRKKTQEASRIYQELLAQQPR